MVTQSALKIVWLAWFISKSTQQTQEWAAYNFQESAHDEQREIAVDGNGTAQLTPLYINIWIFREAIFKCLFLKSILLADQRIKILCPLYLFKNMTNYFTGSNTFMYCYVLRNWNKTLQICFLISLVLALAPRYLHLNFFPSDVVFDLSVCENYQSDSPVDWSLPFIHPLTTKFKFPFQIKVPLSVLARPPRGRNHLDSNHTYPILALSNASKKLICASCCIFLMDTRL